jgi:hypothetical protein
MIDATQVLLSFLIGGFIVSGCTIAAERFGTNVGGIIGGFPSTIAVSLFFIALVTSPETAAAATDIVPLVLAINCVFLICFAATARLGPLPSMASALSAWGALASLSLTVDTRNFTVNILVYLVTLAVGHHILHKRLQVPSCQVKQYRASLAEILTRGLLSGTVIAAAVCLSKISGPVAGGMFSVFPAVFLATLFTAHRSHGADFALSLTRPLLVSSMVNLLAYALAVRLLYPSWGLAAGTVAAFLVAGVTAYATFRFVQRS